LIEFAFITCAARVVLFSVLSVCMFVCLFVCLSVCQHDNSWTARDIITKFQDTILWRADKFVNDYGWVDGQWFNVSDVLQCESKNPPYGLWQFFSNVWELFDHISHAYSAFQSTLYYELLLSYLQLLQSYPILSMTTQFTSCAQNVHHRPKCTLAFSGIFPKQLGIFRPSFIRLLSVPIYARKQIFIQLSSTVTKLCHIKCDSAACISVDGGHFEHIMVVALNMA